MARSRLIQFLQHEAARVFLLPPPPPRQGCQSIPGHSPAICQVFPTIYRYRNRYLFTLLGAERYCERSVACPLHTAVCPAWTAQSGDERIQNIQMRTKTWKSVFGEKKNSKLESRVSQTTSLLETRLLKPFYAVRGRGREWWNGTEKNLNGIAGENNTNHFRQATLFYHVSILSSI